MIDPDVTCTPPFRLSNLSALSFVSRAAAAIAETATPTPQPDLPTAPVLILDAYWQDLGDSRIDKVWPWDDVLALRCRDVYEGQAAAAADAPAYSGAILKVTQGTGYPARALAWFRRQWGALAAPARDGRFLRGAYHYLMFRQDGRRQADYYLDQIDQAGGLRPDDVMPIVDVEFGGEKADNRKASRQQVIDCASPFTARVRERTGRPTILYGGSALAALGIKDRLGCRWLWPAAYTRSLKRAEATSIGWTVDQIVMWQYTDGTKGSAVTARGTVLPIGVHGVGRLDCSVVTQPGGIAGARAALIAG